MHRNTNAQATSHALAAEPQHGSAVPLIAGFIGYVAVLPLLAFGVCAFTLFA